MRKLFITILFSSYLFFPSNFLSAENKFNIKWIKNIGDNRNEYTFFRITAGVISTEKNIYIGDSGGHFIAKYNWNGEYLNRIGQPGQGPGDFNLISDLTYSNKKIYAYDSNIRRITIMDTNLEPIKYIKKERPIRGNIFVTKNESILCSGAIYMDNENKRIELLNSDGKLIRCFFKQTQFGKYRSQKDQIQWAVDQWTSKLITGYSKNKSEIIISFEYPVNPVKFFVYDLNGKLVKTFSYNADKKYQFPDFLKSFPLKYPQKKVYYLTLSSLFIYKNYYLVFINYYMADKGRGEIEKNKYLVFDHQGKLLADKELKQRLKFFNLTYDGYLIGINPDDEIPKAVIYNLLF